MPKKTIGIVVLAAGNSSRLGRAKQLLPFGSKTLIRHVVDEALLAQADKVIVVTGAGSEAIAEELEPTHASLVQNEQWQEGMGTSIKKGLAQLLVLCPEVSAVLITVCDQPFVSAQTFINIMQAYQQNTGLVVASTYAGIIGTPALYDKTYFDELFALNGQEGAKKLLMKHQTKLVAVPFEKGEMDIDTLEDYQKLSTLL